MGTESTYKGKIESWDRLQERLNANAADIAHLEGMRKRLSEVTEQARQVQAAQAAKQAAKQTASQTLKSAVVEGDRLANLLRSALKQHYGIRSEKPAEFGLQPFRGRNRTLKAKGPGAKQPQAPEPHATPSPTETAENAAE
ncbi:MAG: hypothetical protein ACJ76N_25885 [Thermoanaerobaculia bacterium]